MPLQQRLRNSPKAAPRIALLLDDLCHDAGADGTTAFADGKRRPSSMAIGAISLTVIAMLSPGMTISVPSGSWMAPVTSVVRK